MNKLLFSLVIMGMGYVPLMTQELLTDLQNEHTVAHSMFIPIQKSGFLTLNEDHEIKTLELQETVTGHVVDSQTGEALPGVNILIDGTSTGTTTDDEGIFELSVPDLEQTLIITYIGYHRLEMHIKGRYELNIELESEVIAGDELVVVGYGTQQRSDLTGSVASIDRRAISDQPVYSIDNVLQGQAAGVQVMATGFQPGEEAQIRIRGNRSFEAGNDPLFVIDGIPMEGGLMDLNPRDIESIEILKDASATAIYGSRGANGVILVTTRQGGNGTRYAISGTYDDNVTTVRNNEFTRISGRLNFDQQITPIINAGIIANYSNTDINRAVDFRRVIGGFPHASAYDADGNIQMYEESGNRNPYFDMQGRILYELLRTGPDPESVNVDEQVITADVELEDPNIKYQVEVWKLQVDQTEYLHFSNTQRIYENSK